MPLCIEHLRNGERIPHKYNTGTFLSIINALDELGLWNAIKHSGTEVVPQDFTISRFVVEGHPDFAFAVPDEIQLKKGDVINCYRS